MYHLCQPGQTGVCWNVQADVLSCQTDRIISQLKTRMVLMVSLQMASGSQHCSSAFYHLLVVTSLEGVAGRTLGWRILTGKNLKLFTWSLFTSTSCHSGDIQTPKMLNDSDYRTVLWSNVKLPLTNTAEVRRWRVKKKQFSPGGPKRSILPGIWCVYCVHTWRPPVVVSINLKCIFWAGSLKFSLCFAV